VQVSDDPTTATVYLEGLATADDGSLALRILPGLDLQVELDGVAVALADDGTGDYRAPQATGLPASIVFHAEGESLALAHPGPIQATIEPDGTGHRLAFSPVIDGELVEVLWIFQYRESESSGWLPVGASAVAIPPDTYRFIVYRRLTTDEGDSDDGLRLSGHVEVVREYVMP